MSTFNGASSVLLALSPWILASIAAAAKPMHDEACNAGRSELTQSRPGDGGNVGTDGGAANPPTPHKRIRAKLAGRLWRER